MSSSSGICSSSTGRTRASPISFPVVSTALISSEPSPIPIWSLRQIRCFEPPCLRRCHSPSPSTLIPVLSIRRCKGPFEPRYGISTVRDFCLLLSVLKSGTDHASPATHAWLVQLSGLNFLVDTATGNDKPLPAAPALDHLHTPFLDHLAAAGVQPEQVDAVLHTHIHADHVGWNTRLRNGKWVPTFPNARHIFSAIEARYGASNDGINPAPDLPPDFLG